MYIYIYMHIYIYIHHHQSPSQGPLGPPDRRLNARDSANPVDGEGVVFVPAGSLHNCPWGVPCLRKRRKH